MVFAGSFSRRSSGPAYCGCRHESPPLDVVAPDDAAEDLNVGMSVVMTDCNFGDFAQVDSYTIVVRGFFKFDFSVVDAQEIKIRIWVGILRRKEKGPAA